jgi:hypothetical protein
MDAPAAPAAEWVQITNHMDYDIQTTFPHQIRKRSNQRIIALTHNGAGYLMCYLNGSQYFQHRIIMEQFKPNPENLPDIDHVNHRRDFNHLDNLRWVSRRDNTRNKSSNCGVQYTYDTELPAEAIIVENYNGHTYSNYYYHQGQFWFYTGESYRRLHINTNARTGYRYVITIDDGGINRNVSIAAYQRTIGEII